MTFLINTLLGFLIAQFSDIISRDKQSLASPKKFNLIFFIKDTWQKIILSLLLSFAISLLVWLNVEDFAVLIGKDWTIANNVVYALIGFAPEIVLQWLKKKYGFLQPTNVEDYQRK